MRLVILSNMSHYMSDGRVVGWGPTVQEINHLASLFEEVHHVGCLHKTEAPRTSLPYTSDRISLVPVPAAGGRGLREKLQILRHVPLYLKTMRRELRRADVVHVRAPANISLLAIVLLTLTSVPRLRWIKYAGNWKPDADPWSYALQRWWLSTRLHKGLVTVNGSWPDQQAHVRSFYNPCLTDEELSQAREMVAAKRLDPPLRLLFVGAVARYKGVDQALRVVALLASQGIELTFDLVGDGDERGSLGALAEELGISRLVRFHGGLPRGDLGTHYARAHVMLFPSRSEGWPKVLSEAMAYGVVPVASDVSCLSQYLSRFRVGRTVPRDDVAGFAAAIRWYLDNPEAWALESAHAVRAAAHFSYRNYLEAVRDLLALAGGDPGGPETTSPSPPALGIRLGREG